MSDYTFWTYIVILVLTQAIALWRAISLWVQKAAYRSLEQAYKHVVRQRDEASKHIVGLNDRILEFERESQLLVALKRIAELEAEIEQLKNELFTQQDINEAYANGAKQEQESHTVTKMALELAVNDVIMYEMKSCSRVFSNSEYYLGNARGYF